MKTVVLLVTTLLVIGMTGCGNTNDKQSSGYLKVDGDKEADDGTGVSKGTNDDPPFLAAYGDEANQATKRAVTAVVKAYYAAAAADQGAKACSLLDTSLASGLAEQQASGSGQNCTSALSLMFQQQQRQFVRDEVATMAVTKVRISGHQGLAVMGFKAMPESDILLALEGNRWKIGALFGSELP
jgi:hypothetical protein